MKRSAWLASLCAFGLWGCATDGDGAESGGRRAGAASTELRAPDARPLGLASVTQEAGGLRVRITSDGLPPGNHGAHLHTTGECDAPDFTRAGPHWNPTGRLHGSENPQGPHLGDIPNLLVGADGRGVVEYTIRGARLEGGDGSLLDVDGAAVVIHASADDYRTDPSGNSGARIACGVLRPVGLDNF